MTKHDVETGAPAARQTSDPQAVAQAGERTVLTKIFGTLLVAVIVLTTSFMEGVCIDEAIHCAWTNKSLAVAALVGGCIALVWGIVSCWCLQPDLEPHLIVLHVIGFVLIIGGIVSDAITLDQGDDGVRNSEGDVDDSVLFGLSFKFVAGLCEALIAALET